MTVIPSPSTPVMRTVLLSLALGAGAPAFAQVDLDRTDPTLGEVGTTQPELEPAPESTARVQQPAQGSTQATQQSDERFAVGSIIINGNEALEDSDFLDLIERFTARPLGYNDLVILADAIAQRARDAGYIFATASVPQQKLNVGVLRVDLDEGKVDEIRIEGADDPAIRRQLAPLATGTPVTNSELERHILLADDISGVRVIDSRFEKEGDTGVLIVRARRSNASAYAELRNNGSTPVGPIRARIDVDLNGVLASADEIDLSFGTTPFQPEELQFARAAYKIVVDASGLELGTHLTYSATQPGAFLADRDIDGDFWSAGVTAQYPLLRRRDLSVWVVGEFEVSDLRQDREGEQVRRDRVPVIRAGLYSRGRLAGGTFRGRLTASRGLEILGATRDDDALASRLDASARFTSLYGWFAWDRSITRAISVALGGRGQLASDPVLATEDLGLGGTSFLRGYNFNERSGDEGIMGFAELRYNLRGDGDWLRSAQVYAFADGGVVSNLEEGTGGGSLASAGGGVRLGVTRDLNFDVELAVPLSGPRFDTDSSGPLVNLRIGQSF